MSKEVLLKGKKPTGEETELRTDANGNLSINIATSLPGENQTDDRLMTMQPFDYFILASAATTYVKQGPGLLHMVVLNNPGSSWEVDIYDGSDTSGTRIAAIRGATVPDDFEYNLSFLTGLYVDATKGTTAGQLAGMYL